MDATTLRKEIEKLRAEAGSRSQMIAGYAENAAQYTRDGDPTRAKVEQDQADRLTREVRELEDKATELERQATEKEDRAKKLDDERTQLQQRIDAIDKEKESLLGGGGFLSRI